MTKPNRLLTFLFTAAAGLAPAAAAPPALRAGKAEMAVTLDVRYAETPGVAAAAQSLDIYAPQRGRGAAVLAYIHGGGWSRGDKRAVGAKADFFTSGGWVFVSINYRLLPAGRHPCNVEDVARALAWIHSNIAGYGGDPARLFVMGHSAGAHLAALAATDHRRLEAAGKSLDILKGVIPLDTNVYDLPALMQSGAAAYGRVFGGDPQVWRDASPSQHVAQGKRLPPFLIFYSRGSGARGENKIRAQQAQAFGDLLRKAGAEAEVYDASDRTHGEINQWFGRPDDRVTAKAMTFLNSLADRPKAGRPGPGWFSGVRMHEWVRAYSGLGEHRTASRADRETSDWLAGFLRGAGLRVEFQEFAVPQFHLRSAWLTVGGKRIDVFPVWPPQAAAQPVRGALAPAPENPAAGSMKGRIALVELDAASRSARAAVFRRLAEAGAAGIVALDYAPEGFVHAENVMRPAVPPKVPALLAGRKDRAGLFEAARRNETAEMLISGEFDPQAAARNVIATVGRGPRGILVSTPYSGWFRCGGERGSGIAVWLALARWAAERHSRFAYTFLASSAHELGYAGMRAFLDTHAPPRGEVAAWLHLGANVALLPESRPARGRRPVVLFTSRPEWEPLLVPIFKDTPWIRVSAVGRPGGKLALVLQRGYAGINLAGGGNRYMHSPADGPETTGPPVLEPAAAALMRMLETIESQVH